MQAPALKLPRDPFGDAFRIHADALRHDQELKRIGALVIVQDGASADESAPTKYPWVRISCVPLESSWIASEGKAHTRTLSCPFRIHVETKVQGTRLEDSSRLGFAILNAFFPTDTAASCKIESALEEAGLDDRYPRQMWWGVGIAGPNGEKIPAPPIGTYAHGWLDLVVNVDL